MLSLREQYPRWGKDKLVILLHRQGFQVSTSRVGRILKRLKERGVLKEPPRNGGGHQQASSPSPLRGAQTQRLRDREAWRPGPGGYPECASFAGVVLKHFIARGTLCRWDVVEAHTRATATTATSFRDTLQARMPFPVKALQVDGGAEFAAQFETECQRRGIPLFVLPPRSPRLNRHVERAQRTHTEEFYEVYDGDLEVPVLNQALQRWEYIYNHIRPHQALDGRTPMEYLKECHPELAPQITVSYVVNEYK